MKSEDKDLEFQMEHSDISIYILISTKSILNNYAKLVTFDRYPNLPNVDMNVRVMLQTMCICKCYFLQTKTQK